MAPALLCQPWEAGHGPQPSTHHNKDDPNIHRALPILRQAFHCTNPVKAQLPKKHMPFHLWRDSGVPPFYLLYLFIPPMTLTSSLQLQRIRIMDLEGVFGPESIHQEPGPHLASIPPLFPQVRKLATCWERLRHCTLSKASAVSLPRLPQ